MNKIPLDKITQTLNTLFQNEDDIYEHNLQLIWDVATTNPEVFDSIDLLNILEAYFGKEEALALRVPNAIPPCYQFAPCSECEYNDYCLNKNNRKEGIKAHARESERLKSIRGVFPDSEFGEF